MKNGKSKIIIIMVIVLLILILAIGGIFAYIATDLFKSNQTLFFKYIGQTLENIKYSENTQIADVEKLKEQMPYTLDANLSFNVGENETDINSNILSKMSLNIQSKINKPEEIVYTKTDLLNNNQKFFTLEYANSNNIYALKSDEIVSDFLGIENDNLKVLAQKFGITDTSAIPNSIETEAIDTSEIFKISQEEKTHISETYSEVLMQSIRPESFSKEKNLTVSKENVTYNTNAYRLSLSPEEIKQIQIALLQTLKEDSITLNFIVTKGKLLGLDEEYLQINKITSIIEEQIKLINKESYTDKDGIDIIVYVDNQKVITTEIIFRNNVKFTIYGEVNENTNTRYMLIENLSATATSDKIEIEQVEKRNNSETTNSILINIDDDMVIDCYLTNIGSAAESNLNTTCEINITQGEITSTFNYEQEINFEEEIDDLIILSRKNCGVVNDYTTEQLQSLIQSIVQRIATVIEEKKQKIGWVENTERYDSDLEQIELNNN